MNKTLKSCLATCVSMALAVPAANAAMWTHYDQDPDHQTVTMPNGAVIDPSGLAKIGKNIRVHGEQRVEQIADNIYMIHGIFYGPVIIERPEGLIVLNSGEHVEDGANFRRLIREQVSEKPIIAVLYDHNHYAKGTSTLLDGDEAIIVAHPKTNDIIAANDGSGLAVANIPEMGNLLNARGDIQFGSRVPAEGPDAMASGLAIDFSLPSGYVESTFEPEDGEWFEVAGLKIQAFHEITDAEDTLTFWIPELELVLDNVFWPGYNMYTLRGDLYRDPQNWMSALRRIRDLNPEIVLSGGGGANAFVGKDKIVEKANALHDGMAFIYDQSIRLSNQGVKPSELKHHIEMPESLLQYSVVNEGYGQFDSFPEAFALENQGWFSGYAEDMHSLPAEVKAERTIALFGGEARTLEAFQQAFQDKEYLWAKDLAVMLYQVDPTNEVYRQSLADTFRALGQRSPGSIVRNFYLASALSLEGDESVTLTYVESEKWIEADPKRAVNHLRVRINPEQAAGMDHMISFAIDGETMGLHVRNSIAEFVENPEQHYKASDATIELSMADFVEYYQGRKAVEGLEMFEMFKPSPMY
ncbi:alkyl sulfatase dimerization domain-containing protein [Aliagarivorans marinus]|uniref:alkyl sulfatase dimerization domain-containing protein n=1 Tax=Aliagarivorans marinus TaxID=561965 RepID=UPI00040B0353|nr:alkyl sulfatase dimerization domain-containing protein [Aliagarivorans marinus]